MLPTSLLKYSTDGLAHSGLRATKVYIQVACGH